MKKILSSPVIKILAILIGYFAAVFSVSAVNRSFDYYIRIMTSDVFGDWARRLPVLPFLLLVVCLALLFYSVYISTRSSRLDKWHAAEFSAFVITAFCVIALCAVSVRQDTFQFSYRTSPHIRSDMHAEFRLADISIPVIPLLLSILAYSVFIALLTETAARFRDKTYTGTFCWVFFFKRYPINQLKGFITLMALAATAVLFAVSFTDIGSYSIAINDEYYWTGPLPMAQINLSVLAISVLALSVLTFLCRIIMSLSAEFDRANEEKLRAERLKTELIANVSHDIRTPLTSVINYVDLLKALPVENEDFEKYVSVLDRKSSRLKTLISDLIDASKASTGNVTVKLQQIDFAEITGQIAGEFDDMFASRNLTFVLRQPEEGQVFVSADSNHLWRVLENLFGNAAKYALPGTRVFAEISLQDGKAKLSLKNTSENPIEMAADDLTEQFMRGDRARRTEGSGLGLHIAKSLTELMGGVFEISVTGDLFEVNIVFDEE